MKTDLPVGFDTTCDQKKIDELKKLFFEEHEKNPGLYDERDVDHLRKSDLHAIRFLMAGEHDVKLGLEALKTAFAWRKSFNLNDLTEESFPKEFFDLAGLFECGVDRFGFPCLWVLVKTIRKVKVLDIHQMQFLAFMVNKIERQCEQLQCWTLVFDCTNIGFCNVNLSLIHFLIDLLRSYFPLSVRYAIVINVPWILNAIQKFVLSLLPEDNKQLIRFLKRKDLHHFISESNIPRLIGGQNDKDIFAHSENCKSIEYLAKELYGLEREETEKVMKPYQNMLKETQLFRETHKANEKLKETVTNNNTIIVADECMECVEAN